MAHERSIYLTLDDVLQFHADDAKKADVTAFFRKLIEAQHG